MITVHHLNNSRSQRVLWLLEELGLPYEVKRYARNAKTMLAPPELKAVHPLGKSPVITDEHGTYAETGAIIEHILEYYGNGRLEPAPRTPERDRFRYWLHYAEGSAMTPLLMKLVFTTLPQRAPALMRPFAKAVASGALSGFVEPQLRTHMDFWESALGQSAWFAGAEFSAADIQMSFPLEAAASRAGLEPGRPRCSAFLKTIHARPAYQRALERGGPYAYATTE
jgi:glutathione S-transferase